MYTAFPFRGRLDLDLYDVPIFSKVNAGEREHRKGCGSQINCVLLAPYVRGQVVSSGRHCAVIWLR